jgi:hypothetical protein
MTDTVGEDSTISGLAIQVKGIGHIFNIGSLRVLPEPLLRSSIAKFLNIVHAQTTAYEWNSMAIERDERGYIAKAEINKVVFIDPEMGQGAMVLNQCGCTQDDLIDELRNRMIVPEL